MDRARVGIFTLKCHMRVAGRKSETKGASGDSRVSMNKRGTFYPSDLLI